MTVEQFDAVQCLVPSRREVAARDSWSARGRRLRRLLAGSGQPQ